jgi:hypothetical protein
VHICLWSIQPLKNGIQAGGGLILPGFINALKGNDLLAVLDFATPVF